MNNLKLLCEKVLSNEFSGCGDYHCKDSYVAERLAKAVIVLREALLKVAKHLLPGNREELRKDALIKANGVARGDQE